jgi:hypothetical protein
MQVILLFVNTVLNILYQLQLQLQLQLELPPPLLLDPYELFDKGEASILKFYLQDKFPMGNLVIKFSIE